jgi:hypothetical protein
VKDQSSLWNAPNAISHICGTVQIQSQGPPPEAICTGKDWSVQPPQTVANIVTNIGQLFNDLGDNPTGNCNLPSVSWVVPDGHWSDHPGVVLASNPNLPIKAVMPSGDRIFNISQHNRETVCGLALWVVG